MKTICKWITMTICRVIWNFGEAHNIPLGRLAPWVFGGMIGSWPRRVKQHREKKRIARIFWKEFDKGVKELRKDPEAWAAEVKERELWNNTLQDGLEDEPPYLDKQSSA